MESTAAMASSSIAHSDVRDRLVSYRQLVPGSLHGREFHTLLVQLRYMATAHLTKALTEKRTRHHLQKSGGALSSNWQGEDQVYIEARVCIWSR